MSAEHSAAAENAAAVVENAGEAAAKTTAQVIDNAQERLEDAQQTAQAITDAALATELGRQIQATQTGLDQCRSELAELRTLPDRMRDELRMTVEELGRVHADALQALRTELTTPGAVTVIASTPPTSEGQPGATEITTVEPAATETTPAVEDARPAPVPKIKRNRFL